MINNIVAYAKKKVIEIGGNEELIDQVIDEVIESGYTTEDEVDFHLQNYYT